jgi:putative transposase
MLRRPLKKSSPRQLANSTLPRVETDPKSDSERSSPFHGSGIDRPFYLPRLPREYYQGDAVVLWTMPLANRAAGWLDELFHARFRERMLHAVVRGGYLCPTYCLMPDHLHFVWMGLNLQSNQINGIKFLREHLAPILLPQKFQHQAHDHVLKEEERRQGAFAGVCFYIVDNARKAGLVEDARAWPFAGAIVPGYPALHPLEENFWPKFWKRYFALRHPEAGQIKKPPIR